MKICSVCHFANSQTASFCQQYGNRLNTRKACYDGFISYRRESGSELASLVKIGVELLGNKNLYLDVEELRTGRFDESLFEAIASSQNFIAILTKDCLDRCTGNDDWFRREIEYAMKLDKNIIPVCATNFEFPNVQLLPDQIRGIISYNAIKYDHQFKQAAFQKILSFMDKQEVDVDNANNSNDSECAVKGQKGDQSADRILDLPSTIKSILTEHKELYQLDNLGIMPNINGELINMAVEKCEFPDTDTVIGILIKGRGLLRASNNDYLIFGENGVYFCNPWTADSPGVSKALYSSFPARKFKSGLLSEISIGLGQSINALWSRDILVKILEKIKGALSHVN